MNQADLLEYQKLCNICCQGNNFEVLLKKSS